MSSPLYFLPKVTLAAAAPAGLLSVSLLASRGLSASFADCAQLADVARCEVMGKGPDGNPGLIVSPLPLVGREAPRRLGYFADDPHQQWTRINERLWVGVDAIAPPTPADLSRKAQHRGHAILLGDGQEWTVPALQLPGNGTPVLPRDMFWDERGEFVTALRPEYAALWERSRRLDEYFYRPGAAGFRTIGFAEALEIILEVIGLNYRVGRIEQRVLRLLTTDNCEQAMGAVVDYQGFEAAVRELEAAQKKTAVPCSTPSSTPGAAASSPATDPPAENST